MTVLCLLLLYRVFTLQIVNGEEYQENYTLKIKKTRDIKSTRGNIYDRNGTLLAYNELAYTITIEDNGSYDTTAEKNESINDELYRIITKLDEFGDSIENDFSIDYVDGTYQYNVEGTSLLRFLADIFGRASTSDLKYNKNIGTNEADATAEQIMEYLMSDSYFGISDEYDPYMAYRITVLRYAMSQNSYQKYISITIASDVSDETVAYISENAYDLQGVEVSEDTIRVYNDSEYFAQIIGYTGKISSEEYEELSAENSEYSLVDIVGKAGIEQYMDSTLQGTKGSEVVYVDNLGKVIETMERTEPTAGNDVYLSIDANLQKAVYQLLEQEVAGILYDKIENITNYDVSEVESASDIIIPIDDVYYALIGNNVIDITTLNDDDSSTTEKQIYSLFSTQKSAVMTNLSSAVLSSEDTKFSDLETEYQDYITYMFDDLKNANILVSDSIDTDDEIYKEWADGDISVKTYLCYAISQGWIDITAFTVDEEYESTEEIYSDLIEYSLNDISDNKDFEKIIYKYMIHAGSISGQDLCLVLYDQGFLTYDEGNYTGLANGIVSAYDFLKDKIKNLEITPANLALDPCSASCVVTDTTTGELLAVVSYPGYDNNKLANTVDATYYASLTEDLSKPLYNYATQERTAPGSTFKMVTATAALAENIITTDTLIEDEGEFTKVTPSAKCWIYPSTHGKINVSEALRDSCNYFFYELGYDLSLSNGNYNADLGIEKLQSYASLYGLDSTTGIEIVENSPKIATEYPVRAAIGQSNNSYTTTELSRYVTAIANSGTVYNYTLLSKVTDSDGNILEEYSPEVKNTVDVLDSTEWDAIHSGMRMVVEELEAFDDFSINVAGKTGTAQTVTTRPNHALFVGYAPYESPQVSIASRIAYGYTSHNAADVSQKILAYYFGTESTEDLLNGQAADISGTTNAVTD
ncbi:MAG: peptidoglycan glycosyltransferase [Lachnospiraceae bacterium]|nr:peptidoglycan glycosyltransferase [Lachnospiraceae bacterium]